MFSDGKRLYPNPNILSFNYVSRWVIQKIIRSDGSEINYQYKKRTEGKGILLYNSFAGVETVNNPPSISAEAITIGQDIKSISYLSSIKYPNNTIVSFIYNSGSRCDGPNADFYNSSEKYLDPFLNEIKITSDYNCLRYVFDQTYSIAPSSLPNLPLEIPVTSPCLNMGTAVESYLYHRLILKGIKIYNCEGTSSEPYYSFEYDPMRLPPRSSGAQDYFGYYNGQQVTANGGQLNIPSHNPMYGSSTNIYGVNKTENSNFAKAGILMNVKNAYGAKLTLGYDGHQLSTFVPNLPTSTYFMGKEANDGIRLYFMTTSDSYHPGKTVQQTFTYSGGQRFLSGGYFNYPIWTGNDNMMFCNNYISPHQLVNGSNHGYSNVTITTKNEAGTLLSKKEINYSNFYDPQTGSLAYVGGSKKYYEQPYTDKQYVLDWQFGLPLAITEYDQNSRFKLKTINSYRYLIDSTSTIGKITNLKKLNITDANGTPVALASEAYRPFTGIALLDKTTVQKYITDVLTINDEVTYTYDSKNNLKTTTTRDSRGVYSYNKNIYNYDINDQAGSTIYNMTLSGLEKLVSTERWRKGATLSDDRLMDATITKYQYDFPNRKIYSQKQFVLQSLNPVAYSTYYQGSNPYGKILAAYNTNQTDPLFQVTGDVLQYDAKGHATEMKQLGQNIYNAMFWDGLTGNMMANVTNARLKDIGFTSFESNISGMSYTGTELITNGGFTYKQAGITTAASISGKAAYKLSNAGWNNQIISPALTSGTEYIITFWCKDFAPTIKDASGQNISYTQVYISNNSNWINFKAKFTASAAGSLLITNPSTTIPVLYIDEIRLFPSDANMSNWVYTPLFGASSSTDPTGRITYYEYDSFGRMFVTKDQEGNIISKKQYHIGQ
jgi:YD repeat-containing protein